MENKFRELEKIRDDKNTGHDIDALNNMFFSPFQGMTEMYALQKGVEHGFEIGWDAAVEQLKADLRTSDLNRQSLWADSVKMADELNYIKAKHTEEISALKSKLKIAVEALELFTDGTFDYFPAADRARKAISEIGGEI